jgi:hypothetical protein
MAKQMQYPMMAINDFTEKTMDVRISVNVESRWGYDATEI